MGFERLSQISSAGLVLLSLSLAATPAPAVVLCDSDCRDADAYCSRWEADNQGKQCAYALGHLCPIKSWVKISQVNALWLACQTVGDDPDYDIYQHFMRRFEGGASISIPLHLQPFIEEQYGIDPEAVRWANVDGLPKSTCIVDCDNIYCNSKEFIDIIEDGYNWQDFGDFAFHQLAHVQQCHQQGGRKKNAELWFENLPKNIHLATLNNHSLTKDSMKELTQKLHDNMPLETEALKKGSEVRAIYMGGFWHKRLACRVFAPDKKTIIYESGETYSRFDCEVKFGQEVYRLMKLKTKEKVAEGGLEPGIYHIGIGRPDIGFGRWLGSFRVE